MTRTVTVVVPTYRRIGRLGECLAGVRDQTLPAAEVVVTVHRSDAASAEYVSGLGREWSALRCVTVDQPGLVAALNCGLRAARGEVVAFTDDDAVPASDWLERIVATFAQDERIAAVGGRDEIFEHGKAFEAPAVGLASRLLGYPTVGKIQWFGRMLGNHHLGVGEARDVDVLKGVNMSYERRAVLAHGFDSRLRGIGSQVHSEMSICLPLRSRGRRVVYDPAILVRHYPAPREWGDLREEEDELTVETLTHNETVQVLDFFGPGRRLVYTLWGAMVGTRLSPGLLVLTVDASRRGRRAWPAFRAAQRGRRAAWRTHARIPRLLLSDARVATDHDGRVGGTIDSPSAHSMFTA